MRERLIPPIPPPNVWDRGEQDEGDQLLQWLPDGNGILADLFIHFFP